MDTWGLPLFVLILFSLLILNSYLTDISKDIEKIRKHLEDYSKKEKS